MGYSETMDEIGGRIRARVEKAPNSQHARGLRIRYHAVRFLIYAGNSSKGGK